MNIAKIVITPTLLFMLFFPISVSCINEGRPGQAELQEAPGEASTDTRERPSQASLYLEELRRYRKELEAYRSGEGYLPEAPLHWRRSQGVRWAPAFYTLEESRDSVMTGVWK